MTVGWFLYIIVIFIYILLVHQVTCKSRTTPLGPKLCERLCLKTAGCLNYIFLTHDLSCDVTGTTEKNTHMFDVTRETSKGDANCESGSQIILTKRGQHKCMVSRGQVQNGQDKNVQKSHYRKDRILFLAYMTPTRELIYYYPANKSFETVTLFLEDIYQGAAHLSSSEVLLYNRARKLSVFKLHGRRSDVIEKSINIVDMATGDSCVYLLTGFDGNRKLKVVERFVLGNELWWRVKRLSLRANDYSKVEYDAQNSKLYLLRSSNGRIHIIDEKSETYTILSYGLSAKNIAVDGRNGLLYYSYSSSVKYLNLADKSHKQVHKLEYDIFSLGFCEGSLFVSYSKADWLVYECGKTCSPLKSPPFKSKILVS